VELMTKWQTPNRFDPRKKVGIFLKLSLPISVFGATDFREASRLCAVRRYSCDKPRRPATRPGYASLLRSPVPFPPVAGQWMRQSELCSFHFQILAPAGANERRPWRVKRASRGKLSAPSHAQIQRSTPQTPPFQSDRHISRW